MPDDLPLPPIREDLDVLPGAPTPEGVPTWNIFDPVRHQYFQISWMAFQMLAHWSMGRAHSLVEKVRETTTASVTQADVQELIQFLFRHNLTREAPQGCSKALLNQAEKARGHWASRLLHQYLFFRIPLWNPYSFLRQTRRFVEPLFTKPAGMIVGLLGVTGLIGVGRHWNAFAHTFLHFFSFEGLVFYLIAFIGVKVLHEMGHAYTAARYGCRVHTMGIAFLLMIPVLYTDTTDSWKLPSRTQRSAIAAAGTLVELSVAMLATFLWNFCPEGVVKSVCFVLATTSWVMGLVINLNPLLRFDGYYVLSDWLGVPNLQGRSFALGRWKLRNVLFGWDDPPPETFPPLRQRFLVGFAWTTWMYRALLFLGIAIVVYHFFFKVLGLLLFFVEMGWFLGWPLYQEGQIWWSRRQEMKIFCSGRLIAAGVLGLLILSVFPLDRMVAMPAVLEAHEHTTIFPPAPAKIVNVLVQEGERVEQGEPLIMLESPLVDQQIRELEHQIAEQRIRLQRGVAYPTDRENHQVLKKVLEGYQKKRDGLLQVREAFTLRAPISGLVMELTPSLHPGRWVNTQMPLAYLIDDQEYLVRALTKEEDHARLVQGNDGWFYPDDPARPAHPVQLRDVHQVAESELTVPYLASVYEGTVPIRKNEQGALIPESSMYWVELSLQEPTRDWQQVIPGVVQVRGEPRSVMGEFWDRVSAVFIRESGI